MTGRTQLGLFQTDETKAPKTVVDWGGPLDRIFESLSTYALEPRIEHFSGGFMYRDDVDAVCSDNNVDGGVLFAGNFAEFSHSFGLVTNDAQLIGRLSEAIKRNMATEEYADARRRFLQSCICEVCIPDLEERAVAVRDRVWGTKNA